MPSAKIGALIATYDEGRTWFLVGSPKTFVADQGYLGFAMNDRAGTYGDNSGQVEVTVTVTP